MRPLRWRLMLARSVLWSPSLVLLGCGGGHTTAPIPPANNSLTVVAGQDQVAGPGASLPLAIQVEYRNGPPGAHNAIGGEVITWRVINGGGSINVGNGVTGTSLTGTGASLGRASVNWTLGSQGVQELRASAQGLSRGIFASIQSASCANPTTTKSADILASETWTPAGSPYRLTRLLANFAVTNGAVITIQPGVIVCVEKQMFLDFLGGARLVANGTAVSPIVFTRADLITPWYGIRLTAGGGTQHTLNHVIVEHSETGLSAGSADPVTITNSVVRGSGYIALSLGAPGSAFLQSTVDGTNRVETVGGIARPAVSISLPSNQAGEARFEGRVRGAAGVGLRIGSGNVRLAQCEVTGSVGNGIELVTGTPGTISIGFCNIFSNGGVGISNQAIAGFTIPAQGNWWGDPAGPNGAGGDGVSGDVNTSSPLAAPLVLNYAPAFVRALLGLGKGR